MAGDELDDIIEQDAKTSSSFENERTTSTKVLRQSNSGTIYTSNSNPDQNSDNQQDSKDSNEQNVSSKIPEKDLYIDLKRYTSKYNSGINEVPELVKSIAGNDIIVLEILTNDNKILKIKAVTKKGFVKEFREVPTLRGTYSTVSVSSNERCIRALISSYDPMGKLSASLNSGDIEIECKGFLKKAAVSALKNLA